MRIWDITIWPPKILGGLIITNFPPPLTMSCTKWEPLGTRLRGLYSREWVEGEVEILNCIWLFHNDDGYCFFSAGMALLEGHTAHAAVEELQSKFWPTYKVKRKGGCPTVAKATIFFSPPDGLAGVASCPGKFNTTSTVLHKLSHTAHAHTHTHTHTYTHILHTRLWTMYLFHRCWG